MEGKDNMSTYSGFECGFGGFPDTCGSDDYRDGLEFGRKCGYEDGFKRGRKFGFRDGYQAAMLSRNSPMCKYAQPDGQICSLFDMPCDGYDVMCKDAEVDKDSAECPDFSGFDFDFLQKSFEAFKKIDNQPSK